MKISYKKLWIMLAEQEMTKQEFREKLQIASGTMTKLNKGQEVSMSIILRICEYFNCNIGDICDFWYIEIRLRSRRRSHSARCLADKFRWDW